MDTYDGRLFITKLGFGIIECSKIDKKIKVDKKNLNFNFDDSYVKFKILKEKDYICYAKIISLPNFKNEIFAGIIHKLKKDIFVYNSKIGKSNLILCESKLKNFKDNDFVLFKINKIKNKKFYGIIIEKIGEYNDDNALTNYLIKLYNLELEFPKKVLLKADKVVNRYHDEFKTEVQKRKDLRFLCTFTIDPNGARDLDDAVSIFRNKNGFKIYIHIADVSYFLKKNNSIDQEAINRSFSVYLPKKVIRMLPPILSENYCSLLPDTDKYAVTTEVNIDNNGNVIDWQTYKSIINSCYKFTYEEVYNILEGKIKLENLKLLNDLKDLKDLSHLLEKKRLKLPDIKYSEEEKKIMLSYSDYTHKMIEELMILNNILVAKTLSKRNIKYPSRYHPTPNYENNIKTIELINLLNKSDINLGISSLQSIVDCDEKRLRLFNLHCIQRLLTKAKYSIDNEGHWALNLSHYSHFTSPIRRLPDLISHRLIFDDSYSDDKLLEILNIVNENENNYQKIDFLIEKFIMIRFLDNINALDSIYDAIIMDIKNSDVIIFIPDIFYIHSMLLSEISDQICKIGNKIHVKLIRIIKSTLELKFIYIKN